MVSLTELRYLSISSDNGPFTAFVTPRIASKRDGLVELEAGIYLRREGGRKIHVAAKQIFSEADYQDAAEAYEAAVHWLECHLESIVFSLERIRKELADNSNFTRE